MTQHLAPEEVVAAVDGTLPAARRRHLERCGACGGEVDRLGAFVAQVRDEDVPEPPAVFWDDLAARVRTATAAEALPAAPAWRAGHAFAAFGALAAAVLVALVWWSSDRARPIDDSDAPAVAATSEAGADPAASWQAVVELSADLSADDVRLVTASAPHATFGVRDLSADERAAFVRLVQAEMGDME